MECKISIQPRELNRHNAHGMPAVRTRLYFFFWRFGSVVYDKHKQLIGILKLLTNGSRLFTIGHEFLCDHDVRQDRTDILLGLGNRRMCRLSAGYTCVITAANPLLHRDLAARRELMDFFQEPTRASKFVPHSDAGRKLLRANAPSFPSLSLAFLSWPLPTVLPPYSSRAYDSRAHACPCSSAYHCFRYRFMTA